MWLINTKTQKLVEFLGTTPPPYAILSHTWENEEISFQEMSGEPSSGFKTKKGYAKIERTCAVAIEQNLDYAWVDTCCIDKTSSAALTESINSMFQWYQEAKICYAYLSDLSPNVSDDAGFPKCRWFTRGWTLQELIAPAELVFYDSEWRVRTTKKSAAYLISQITRIQSDYLWDGKMIKFASVADKMSWASRRETTRIEDMAYCLLGLFDINMPMLYGEGSKAFIRLQEEIIKNTNDMTLFAWKPLTENEDCCSVLAASPSVFENCSIFGHQKRENDFSVTNKGILITTQLLTPIANYNLPHMLLYLGSDMKFQSVYLVLQKWEPDLYVRDNSISEGVWISSSSYETQPLGRQSFYLSHTPNLVISQASLNLVRSRAVRLNLKNGLKVFEVTPQNVWDPVHSLLLNPTVSVAMLLGFPLYPYGSIWVLNLSGRTKGTLYVLPTSSPAIPYILKNLTTLTRAELQRYWNLSPVYFPEVANFSGEPHQYLVSQSLACENKMVTVAAGFREVLVSDHGDIHGRSGWQQNHLTISAMEGMNLPRR